MQHVQHGLPQISDSLSLIWLGPKSAFADVYKLGTQATSQPVNESARQPVAVTPQTEDNTNNNTQTHTLIQNVCMYVYMYLDS